MVPVFHIIVVSDLVYEDRWPAAILQSEIDIHPTIPQVAFERTELIIEVTLPVQRANDLFDADIICTNKFPIWTLPWRLLREWDQTCIPSG